MSNHFLRGFIRNFIFIFNNSNNEPHKILFKIGFCANILLGHCIYVSTTEKKELITVEKKYTMDRQGFTDFMIIDNKGRHFNVSNSFWYWKWNSIEDWHKINTCDTLFIKYYGYRIPVFGIFPNIVSSNCQVD